MRITLLSTLALILTANLVLSSTWFGKAVYNKWHETELERWLSDNNIPYPTPADRKDLEDLIKKNWHAKVVAPYEDWNIEQLQSYLTLKGKDAEKTASKNKDDLLQQVKATWWDTEEKATEAWNDVKQWIFDSWGDSQLKAFLDRNGIPSPQPRTQDKYIAAARENYQIVANKLGETAAYPGDWLYESWSVSDLKAWLDERGIPAPQPTSRDKLIATVRRNSRLAAQSLAAVSASAASEMAAATNYLTDKLLESWSDSQIKAWADENGIPVPQGSKRNELIALARKHRASFLASVSSASAKASKSGTSAYGAATSSAGNEYAKATDDASLMGGDSWVAVQNYWDWVRMQAGLLPAPSYTALSASRAASMAARTGTASAKQMTATAASKAGGFWKKATDSARVDL